MEVFSYRARCGRCGVEHVLLVSTSPAPGVVEPVSDLAAIEWPACYNCLFPLPVGRILTDALAWNEREKSKTEEEKEEQV